MPTENRKSTYLSGPMTGLPGLNFPAFAAMTANLRADGHTVTNPIELNPNGGFWTDCMRRESIALGFKTQLDNKEGAASSDMIGANQK